MIDPPGISGTLVGFISGSLWARRSHESANVGGGQKRHTYEYEKSTVHYPYFGPGASCDTVHWVRFEVLDMPSKNLLLEQEVDGTCNASTGRHERSGVSFGTRAKLQAENAQRSSKPARQLAGVCRVRLDSYLNPC